MTNDEFREKPEILYLKLPRQSVSAPPAPAGIRHLPGAAGADADDHRFPAELCHRK